MGALHAPDRALDPFAKIGIGIGARADFFELLRVDHGTLIGGVGPMTIAILLANTVAAAGR